MSSPTPQQSPSTPYSPDEISKHSSADDLWIIIDGAVYDVSKFINEHPGGPKSTFPTTPSPHPVFCIPRPFRESKLCSCIYSANLVLLTVAGKDATKKFRKYHRDSILNRYKERLRVGSVVDEGKKSRFSLKAMLKK